MNEGSEKVGFTIGIDGKMIGDEKESGQTEHVRHLVAKFRSYEVDFISFALILGRGHRATSS
jgi:hypothetical protein